MEERAFYPHQFASMKDKNEMTTTETRPTNHAVVVCALSLFLLFVSSILGQTASRPDRGASTLAPYSRSDVEDINLQNGNLGLKIPLASLPSMAGGKLGFTVYAYYNSKLWDTYVEERHTPPNQWTVWYPVSIPRPSNFGGWSIGAIYSVETEMAVDDYVFDQGNPSPEIPILESYRRTFLSTPDGSRHEMRPLGPQGYSGDMTMFFGYVNQSPATTGQPMTYYSTDGSYIRMVIYPPSSTLDWEAFLADGTKVEQSRDPWFQRITDANGNKIKIFSGPEGIHYQDEYTGREIRKKFNASTGRTEIWYQSVGGTWNKVEVVSGTTQVRGKFYTVSVPDSPSGLGCEYHEPTGETLGVVREIIFPATELNPPRYLFEYNSDLSSEIPVYVPSCNASYQPYHQSASYGLGEISKMTTPLGAIHEYEFSLDGEAIVNPSFSDWNIASSSITKKKVTHDGAIDVWSYSSTEFGATVTNPDGSQVQLDFHGHLQNVPAGDGGSSGLGGLVYRETRPGGIRVERRWSTQTFSGASTNSPGGLLAFNPVVTQEFTSHLNESGNPVLMSARTFQYDFNGNLLETKEYDWFDPSLISRDGNGVPAGVPGSAVLLRTTNVSFHNSPLANSSLDVYAKTSNTHLNAAKEAVVGNSITRFSYDGLSFGIPPTNGNLTKTSVWDSAGNQWIDSTTTYDSRGNVTSTTDPNGNVTQITYGSINGYTDLYPTQTVIAHGTSVARTSSVVYDFFTGLPLSSTDEDNNLTNSTEYDILLRPIKVISADGEEGFESWTVTEYHDEDRYVVVRADLEEVGDGKKVAIQHFDQLGRVRLSRTLENAATEDPANESHGIKVETRYLTEPGYTYQLTSNPYRTNAEPTFGWTRSKVWSNGRRSETETFTGSSLPAPWGSNPNSTGVVVEESDVNTETVTDEAGKKRRTIEDALGRLIRVDEPDGSGNLGTVASPNQATSYSHDTLGNLTQIVQGGQTRTFTYNSLSRLLSATNPESGTFTYSYDPNGNLLTKTDARSISTTYTYDALNRVTFRNYNDSTPDITYTYDDPQVPFSKGKLTKVSSPVSETSYLAFDAQERIIASRQRTDGHNYDFAYTYNLADDLKTQTYPSGKVVSYAYDQGGDLSAVSGVTGSTYRTYANAFGYAPHGVVEKLRLGNGRWETTQFNGNRQIVQVGLGSSATNYGLWKINYEYGELQTNGTVDAAKDNGNLARQTITVPTFGGVSGFIAIQSYTYDSLDRLKSAAETVSSNQTWKQTFSYDRFGNRNFDTGNTTIQSVDSTTAKVVNPEILTSNNRFKEDQDSDSIPDYLYDSSGNITKNARSQDFTYDAENRQVTAAGTGLSTSYAYDPNGKRVKSHNAVNGQTTVLIYDASGLLSAEYTIDVPAPANPTISYLTEDALGSVRVTTDTYGQLKARRDFLPFGEELYSGLAGRNTNQKYSASADDTRKKFATYQRDAETGLDYAQSRYYSPMHGRFTSPDEFKGGPDELFDFEEDASDNPTFYADLTNPQSLNKYQYTYNNPYKYNDPSGHCPGVLRLVCHPAVQSRADKVIDAIKTSSAGIAIGSAVGAAISSVDKAIQRRGGIDPDLTAAGRYARAVESGQPQFWQMGKQPQSKPQPATPAKASGQASAGGSLAKPRGSRNPKVAKAAAEGRKRHSELKARAKEKKGWQSEPSLKDPKTGDTVRPDLVTPSGRPLEYKPNTPSGRAKGKQQLPAQERATGKKGRVIYYEPKP